MALIAHEEASIAELADLSGRTAVVTGGGQGIGHAICARFAEAGALVTIADLDGERADVVAHELAAEGCKATAYELDVTQSGAVEVLAQTVKETHGSLDIWVNNAGIYPFSPALDITDADWRHVLAVNVDGVFFGARAAGRVMCEQRTGVIINIASTASFRAEASTHYVTSKHAVIGLTRSLAGELAKNNVRVVAIAPGPTVTEGAILAADNFDALLQVVSRPPGVGPSGRLGMPDDIARVAYFAATGLASFVTGSVLMVEGGYHVS